MTSYRGNRQVTPNLSATDSRDERTNPSPSTYSAREKRYYECVALTYLSATALAAQPPRTGTGEIPIRDALSTYYEQQDETDAERTTFAAALHLAFYTADKSPEITVQLLLMPKPLPYGKFRKPTSRDIGLALPVLS